MKGRSRATHECQRRQNPAPRRRPAEICATTRTSARIASASRSCTLDPVPGERPPLSHHFDSNSRKVRDLPPLERWGGGRTGGRTTVRSASRTFIRTDGGARRRMRPRSGSAMLRALHSCVVMRSSWPRMPMQWRTPASPRPRCRCRAGTRSRSRPPGGPRPGRRSRAGRRWWRGGGRAGRAARGVMRAEAGRARRSRAR